MELRYKRVLLKVSGASLAGTYGYGIDESVLKTVAEDIGSVRKLGVEVCVVVGGGNFYRGSTTKLHGASRASVDYMGMLATVINALALQNAIEALGLACRVLSAVPMTTICEPYIRRRAFRHLFKGRVVVFAAGIGNPFFSTDTASVLRAVEMDCDVLIKGTGVNGVYSADPRLDKDAVRYEHVSYKDVLSKELKIMDASAISLAREHQLPILICKLLEGEALFRIVHGEGVFTVIGV